MKKFGSVALVLVLAVWGSIVSADVLDLRVVRPKAYKEEANNSQFRMVQSVPRVARKSRDAGYVSDEDFVAEHEAENKKAAVKDTGSDDEVPPLFGFGF